MSNWQIFKCTDIETLFYRFDKDEETDSSKEQHILSFSRLFVHFDSLFFSLESIDYGRMKNPVYQSIINTNNKTNEETFSTVQSLFSSHSVHKVDPSEA